METQKNNAESQGNNDIDMLDITSSVKRALGLQGYNLVNWDKNLEGIHSFPNKNAVYWTDAKLDASTKEGREAIAELIGVKLSDIVSFSAINHTNEVVIIDSPQGIKKVESIPSSVNSHQIEAGWSEPISMKGEHAELGSDRGTYDGIILVGKNNFDNKYLLATGADCTPVGVRGRLANGEDFIAIIHGGRKGTMTGIVENLAKRLGWLGAESESLEIFVGPAAQSIEVPVDVLENESSGDNSWRVSSVSQEYEKDGTNRFLYNNQFDTVRRLVESLNINPTQVQIIDADTVKEDNKGKLHSYRRDKTSERNCLIIGFSKNL